MTPHGDLCLDGETVCFDLAGAMEMAESDCEWAAGACVYAFDQSLEIARLRLVAAFGLLASTAGDRTGPARMDIRHIA